jgi:alkylation response protein AidB-like acyl-CoA dehydrogenase
MLGRSRGTDSAVAPGRMSQTRTELRALSVEPDHGPDPLTLADALAEELAVTAAERDQRGGTAKHERDRLRGSGLLTLVVDRAEGGWGAPWSTALEVVRRIARADSALAHLLGFQYLMLATSRLFGSETQWQRLHRETVRRTWFWGNALNPLDRRTIISGAPGARRIAGTKSFCSGAVDADMLIVSALPEGGQGKLVVAALPGDREGIHVLGDWDAFGQRQTDSGTVELKDVVVHEDELLATPGPLGSVFASLRPCIAQLALANIYLGIGEGALGEARGYTHTQARPWIASGVPRVQDDPYVLARYGELWLALESARALADEAGRRFDRAWAAGDDLTPAVRGATALGIAAAKVSSARAGLEAASRMFEVMGARATAGAARLDRYWRNVRVHTLHDPVDYKVKELGRFALEGVLPEPSFYS